MTLTRRRFLAGRNTFRGRPPKPTKLKKEEKQGDRSGRAAALAEAYGSSRIGLIVEM